MPSIKSRFLFFIFEGKLYNLVLALLCYMCLSYLLLVISTCEPFYNLDIILVPFPSGVVSGVATTVLVAVKNGSDVNVVNLEDFVECLVVRRYTNSVL